MPAEDLRLAEAHRKVNGATYAKYLTSKARVDALRAWLQDVRGPGIGPPVAAAGID